MNKIKHINFKLLFISFGFIFFINSCKEGSNTENEKVKTESSETKENRVVKKEISSDELVKEKDQSKLNSAQLQVQKLLESCVADNYELAAKTIMYRGKDNNRAGQDFFNYNNANEANTVKVTCEVVKGWLGASENYEFISYKEVDTDLGPQHVVEIMFKKEKLGVSRHFFYLVDTPKGMLLVNML